MKKRILNVFHAHCVLLIQLIEVRINIFSISISIQKHIHTHIWNLRFLSSFYLKRDESYIAGHYWKILLTYLNLYRRSILIKKIVIEFQIFTHMSPPSNPRRIKENRNKYYIANYIPLEAKTWIRIMWMHFKEKYSIYKYLTEKIIFNWWTVNTWENKECKPPSSSNRKKRWWWNSKNKEWKRKYSC